MRDLLISTNDCIDTFLSQISDSPDLLFNSDDITRYRREFQVLIQNLHCLFQQSRLIGDPPIDYAANALQRRLSMSSDVIPSSDTILPFDGPTQGRLRSRPASAISISTASTYDVSASQSVTPLEVGVTSHFNESHETLTETIVDRSCHTILNSNILLDIEGLPRGTLVPMSIAFLEAVVSISGGTCKFS
jgi:hypothetical protein